MGNHWTHCHGRGQPPGGGKRRRIPPENPAIAWVLERGALHCDRIPTRLLFALSRVLKVLPSVGTGALQMRDGWPVRRIRNVMPPKPKFPVIAVTGLAFEARIAKGPGVHSILGTHPERLSASITEA